MVEKVKSQGGKGVALVMPAMLQPKISMAKACPVLSKNAGSGRSDTSLSVVGRVHECLPRDGQQFEHFT